MTYRLPDRSTRAPHERPRSAVHRKFEPDQECRACGKLVGFLYYGLCGDCDREVNRASRHTKRQGVDPSDEAEGDGSPRENKGEANHVEN